MSEMRTFTLRLLSPRHVVLATLDVLCELQGQSWVPRSGLRMVVETAGVADSLWTRYCGVDCRLPMRGDSLVVHPGDTVSLAFDNDVVLNMAPSAPVPPPVVVDPVPPLPTVRPLRFGDL